jgi:tetratricopeptide (TPR) repeat protein
MVQLRIEYIGAFFLALLLRGIYLQGAWYGNELIDYPIVDAEVYVTWAKEILQGKLLWSESSNYTPAYPLYLASWFRFLGDRTFAIFLAFHVIGAAQAVVIGLLAEEIWDWKEGLVAAFLAATYWPFIVFEASFFAEPFALWTASVGLLLLVRSARTKSSLGLFAAGLFIGLASLVRANLLLCFPVMCLWLAMGPMRAGRGRTRTAESEESEQPESTVLRRALLAARPALVFALPLLLLAAPIVAWNLQVTGRAILRSQAGLTLFLGNNPDFGGLVVRPGVEWRDLTIEPLRADKTTSREREEYWNARTLAIVKSRPGDWLALQWKKLSMHLGAFEVSQEIDVSRFRRSSSILALPWWPGFGVVMPLALAGIFVVLRRREREATPLLLFAALYFAALLPFQAAARYRLPLLLALIPLAAHLVVWSWERARAFEWREWLPAGLVLALGFALVLPDYTDLAGRNNVRHDQFVARKYQARGDPDRALQKFAEAARIDARDADSPLWMGQLRFERGEFARAKAHYVESRRRYQPNPEALHGLAHIAMQEEDYGEARRLVELASAEWPHSQPGLRLQKEIARRQEDWETVRATLLALRAYTSVPAAELFELGSVEGQFGNYEGAIDVHNQIAANVLFGAQDRSRALFTNGALMWRQFGDADSALDAWGLLVDRRDLFFGALAAYLVGVLDEAELLARFPERGGTGQFVTYTRGLAAWMRGDAVGAREAFRAVIDQRGAASLARSRRTVPESWALADIEKL